MYDLCKLRITFFFVIYYTSLRTISMVGCAFSITKMLCEFMLEFMHVCGMKLLMQVQ